MKKKKIVVALGGNALGSNLVEQMRSVTDAVKPIADLIEEGYEVVVTHGNGPQVGVIQDAMTLLSREYPEKHPHFPLSVCTAMSQGYIGYDLQNAIRSELLGRGIYKTVSSIITQVKVDPFDKAFNNPTKMIGRLMTKDEADHEREKGNYVEYEEGDEGYRRIIASPRPVDIYEIDAIKTLSDAHQVVIAAGGGGIPVLEQRTALKGASAIIEKDYTAAKMADMLDASALMILTSSDYLTYDKDGEQVEVKEISKEDAKKLIDDGYFDPVTSLPKIDASLSFVLAKDGRKAIITNLDKALDGIEEKVGTIIK